MIKDKFKFHHRVDPVLIYTYNKGTVSWEERGEIVQVVYTEATAKVFIQKGSWVLIEEEEEKEMSNCYIVSNQIRCTKCGGEPFSMHRHDFQSCECGAVSVDGGQAYLRRLGSGWEEMSITIDKEALTGLVGAVEVSMTSGRNYLGVALAALRGLRDHKLFARVTESGVIHYEVCNHG